MTACSLRNKRAKRIFGNEDCSAVYTLNRQRVGPRHLSDSGGLASRGWLLSPVQLTKHFRTQFSYLGNGSSAYSCLAHIVGRIIKILVMDVKDAFTVINDFMLEP